MLVDHHVQQVVRQCGAEDSKLRIMVRDQRADQPSKNWEILSSRAILLGFLHSLVSAIRIEANKINQRREERPIGLPA